MFVGSSRKQTKEARIFKSLWMTTLPRLAAAKIVYVNAPQTRPLFKESGFIDCWQMTARFAMTSDRGLSPIKNSATFIDEWCDEYALKIQSSRTPHY